MPLNQAARPDNDEMLVKALCKELHLSYAQLPLIWAEKFIWQTRLWNNVDYLGFAQRLCKDVTNLILSDKPTIWTRSEYINWLIEEELYGRLQLCTVLGRHLTHCMGIGDMVMSVYRDPIDGRPAINYITGQNVIPISYNSHTVSELAWFQKTKIKDKVFVTCVIESLEGRKTLLYEFTAGQLNAINYGTPLWYKIIGNTQPEIIYDDEELPVKKFAWISTGLNNPRWIDTPFHNSFIWPIVYLDALEKDWKRIDDEFELSGKAVFLSPELIRKSVTMMDENGFPIEMKKANVKSGLFQAVDLSEDKIKEWAPNVRYAEFANKIQFDLKMLTQAVGLGSEFYNFDYPKIEMTATQTVLSHRECYNTINAIKYNLESAFKTIVYALICEWFKEGLIPKEEMDLIVGPGSIDVDFDDSVFVNKDAKTDLGIRLMNSSNTMPGMRNIDQKTLLTDYAGYSSQKADAIIAKTQKEFEQATMLTALLAQNGVKA